MASFINSNDGSNYTFHITSGGVHGRHSWFLFRDDGLHLTAEGYKLMGKAVAGRLIELLNQ